MTTKIKPPDKRRIVCGIRPTGNVHLGNYLGLADSALFAFVIGYESI